jgi:hypothetical protein
MKLDYDNLSSSNVARVRKTPPPPLQLSVDPSSLFSELRKRVLLQLHNLRRPRNPLIPSSVETRVFGQLAGRSRLRAPQLGGDLTVTSGVLVQSNVALLNNL